MEPLTDIITKIALSLLFGGLIGLERELKHKPAGLRTTILICLGSTVYMIVGINTAKIFGGISDPARIAAQVVTGIGFLGAGAIIQSRGSVLGLTTAASIWVVASIGIAVGNGFYMIAFIVTLTVIIVLNLILFIENKFKRRYFHRYVIVSKSTECIFDALKKLTPLPTLILEKIRIEKINDNVTFEISCEGDSDVQNHVFEHIAKTEGIEKIEKL
ncbi:MgtC/SapB family protein [candidate division KSB1 bacterium]